MEEKQSSEDDKSESAVVIPGFDSFEQFVQAGFKTVIEASKSSNRLPCGKSRDLYESCPSFHRIMKAQGDAVLGELSRAMKLAGCKGNVLRRGDEERQEMIVDANDIIFERVGTTLDDIAGIRRNPDAEFVGKAEKQISGSWNKRTLASRTTLRMSSGVSMMLQASKNMDKPQINFAEKVDNARNTVFVPKIKMKHNILKPLAVLFEDDEDGGQYTHPYEFEIEKFSPAEEELKEVEPVKYASLEDTPLLYVSNTEQVQEMMEHLRKAKAIAIDLEHHSYRSFQGFTCLMQISTRERDFIVDTIALREDLQDLNEVFTNPKVVKVLHGAQMDIQWLQRDLGLYIVNMFDTHIAAKHLNYSTLSLAYLLNRFCGVQAQKQFQLADWRIRPLPEEMLQYAREDTHYLLYIFDMMKNFLLEKANGQDNLLRSVFSESSQLCLKRYIKPRWHPEDHMHLYHKSKRLFNNRQLFALQQLYDWRDKTARDHDESIGFVLPNHMLLHMADVLPREVQGILACCNPVPLLVRQNLTALHYIIRRGRDQPLVKPIQDVDKQVDRTPGNGLNADSPLRCPHDVSWMPEFRPDLPVLLDSSDSQKTASNQPLRKKEPKVSVFESVATTATRRTTNGATMTPYQRYKLVKPYADAEAKDVSSEVEANKEAVQQKKIDEVEKAVKKEPEEPEGRLPIKKQFEKNEKRTKIDRAEVFEESTKKKLKTDKVEPVLKKKEKVKKKKLLKNPLHSPAVEVLADSISTEKPRKNVKKKEESTARQNFDYSSVDYRKFQSNPEEKVIHNEKKNRIRNKKLGKKSKGKLSI